jgi:hypothetical protein
MHTRGDLVSDLDSFWMIFKQGHHLQFGFQITFAVLRKQIPGFVDGRVIFYAGKNVKEFAVVLIGIRNTIACEIGKSQLVRIAEKSLVYRLFVAQMMALKLNIEPLFENVI